MPSKLVIHYQKAYQRSSEILSLFSQAYSSEAQEESDRIIDDCRLKLEILVADIVLYSDHVTNEFLVLSQGIRVKKRDIVSVMLSDDGFLIRLKNLNLVTVPFDHIDCTLADFASNYLVHFKSSSAVWKGYENRLERILESIKTVISPRCSHSKDSIKKCMDLTTEFNAALTDSNKSSRFCIHLKEKLNHNDFLFNIMQVSALNTEKEGESDYFFHVLFSSPSNINLKFKLTEEELIRATSDFDAYWDLRKCE